ncbi:MAG: isoleucine--tRNA ligase [Defluviitaleaceae bacterium]|nr:isoleucine--tRNA ligase [Defluviitaleaceae bacterium]MCL2264031.1 isoleucine--tRNA ligase [Defluviitaleaceae bacterium]
MYEKVSTGLNFAAREKDVLKLWRENEVFEKSINLREGGENFTFYEGPPTANGHPHIGHIITRTVKDLVPRYKAMKGFHVKRKAGWDTHGLPVELEVEKMLGISGKPEIETYGVEPFIKKCKESVWKYEGLWREMSERVGFWADMDAPYVTYHNEYIESVWWALSQIFAKGLIYKSYRVVPYCPRCGTPLSSHELAQGYKDVTEDSVYVCFKAKGAENEFFLAWTTTPWTLPSNVGLCVNPKEEYAKVSSDGKVYILAKALVASVFGDAPHEILETVTGKDLEGTKYEPLFDFAKGETSENYCMVVCDSYVTLTDGTGIVHIAPAFGEDDARISKAYGLPLLQMVDAQGCFISDVHLWAGMFVKDADPLIIKELKMSGKMFRKNAYKHSYPFCWRCDTPLLYYARDAWFIRMSSLRDKLLESNSAVNWLPGHMKEGRFGDFLENVIDWSISRERYWGTPLPIWVCDSESCGHLHCVGSIAELKKLNPSTPDDIELHKPYIDAVKIPCEKCGGQMTRTPEVIDCWFDSGSMPFAQWHYPFENKDIFAKQFPADFISEAVDQTRGWFYSLIAISTMLFEKSPYKNVIVLGHGLDEHGQKMSKSKGNAVNPMEALEKHGADAIRWFLISSSAPWLNFRYSDDGVTEGARRFMGTLWNTYAFFVLYAEIDGFDPYKYETPAPSVMDKWLLSRLNTLIKKVDSALERFELTEPARALDQFVDEMSNWYLRRSRERYWGKDMTDDKISAYKTLHHALVTVSKLAAPFVPFITEQIYQNLVVGLNGKNEPISIHLADFPDCDESQIDTQLEQQMAVVMDIVVQGRSARNTANTKIRQPLAQMFVSLAKPLEKPLSAELEDVIKDELNVKEIKFIADASEYMSYKFKPQLRTLGPRYGKIVPKITEALNAAPSDVMAALKAGTWTSTVDGTAVELTMEDVLVETQQKEGFSAAAEKGVTVVLETTLTPELIEEGNMRELISKFQNMRREAGFEVTDHIKAGYSKSPTLSAVMERNAAEISHEILANELTSSSAPSGAFAKEWNVNGEKIELWVVR